MRKQDFIQPNAVVVIQGKAVTFRYEPQLTSDEQCRRCVFNKDPARCIDPLAKCTNIRAGSIGYFE